jgi:hypothetical protein
VKITALAQCILGKFLGVLLPLFSSPSDVPTFAPRCLYFRTYARDPSSERWNCWLEICQEVLPKFRIPLKFRDLLLISDLRHATDGFTSPPKEGLRRRFSPGKFLTTSAGLDPRIWVQKASTPPLDHRSRSIRP